MKFIYMTILLVFAIGSNVLFANAQDPTDIPETTVINEQPADAVTKSEDPVIMDENVQVVERIGVQRMPSRNREFCSSSNDPHLMNFIGSYEFQYEGQFCLLNNGHVKVSAQFNRCSPSSPTPTCNCMVKMQLVAFPGIFVEFNTCGGPTLITTSDVPLFTCSNTILINIQDYTEWASLTPPAVPHPNFQCASTLSGGIAIKSIQVNPDDDVLVLFYPSPGTISQIQVFKPVNYFSCDDKDCLCGNFTSTKYPISYNPFQPKEQQKVEFEQKLQECEKVVVGETVRIHFFPVLTREATKRIDKLVQDCAIDALAFPKEPIGKNQLPFRNGLIIEALFDTHAHEINTPFGLKETGTLWEIIKLFCACKGQVPNRECLIFGRCCNEKFHLCKSRFVIPK